MHSLANMCCLLLVPVLLVTGTTLIVLWYYNIALIFAIIAPFATILFVYLALPILFWVSSSVQRYLVYLAHAMNPPDEFDFGDTEGAGLTGCRNFYLFPTEGEYIGVWHLLAQSLIPDWGPKPRIDRIWEDALRTGGKHVVIYFHGNTGSRALDHRKELYWVLQSLDMHVIAFDYRGFGDSMRVPISEETTVADGIFVYKWLRRVIGPESETKIFVWGHSLGTGISSHVVAKLLEDGDHPTGLILESPFTNLGEAMRHNQRAKIYRYMPYFESIFISSLRKNGIAYETDNHIKNIHISVLILHAIDDATVPHALGVKLFEAGQSGRPSAAKPIHIREFPKGHGHKLIHTSPELPFLIQDFVRACMLDDWCNFRC